MRRLYLFNGNWREGGDFGLGVEALVRAAFPQVTGVVKPSSAGVSTW